MHQFGKMAAQVYGNIRANGGSRLKAGTAAAGVALSPFIAGAVIYGVATGVNATRNHEPAHMHGAPNEIARVFEDSDPAPGYESGTTFAFYDCGHVDIEPIPQGLYQGRTRTQIEREFAEREIDPLDTLEERVVFR